MSGTNNGYPKCPECGGKIKMGIAIPPKSEYNSRALVPWIEIITFKNMRFIDVYKCEKCGYSCDDERDLVWSNKNENFK